MIQPELNSPEKKIADGERQNDIQAILAVNSSQDFKINSILNSMDPTSSFSKLIDL